jgi:hypothetical protein
MSKPWNRKIGSDGCFHAEHAFFSSVSSFTDREKVRRAMSGVRHAVFTIDWEKLVRVFSAVGRRAAGTAVGLSGLPIWV